jgi:hypothetical protein
MPLNFSVGDRVVTNSRFSVVYARTRAPRHGVVTGATHVGQQLLVRLDDCKNPGVYDPRLFDRETGK